MPARTKKYSVKEFSLYYKLVLLIQKCDTDFFEIFSDFHIQSIFIHFDLRMDPTSVSGFSASGYGINCLASGCDLRMINRHQPSILYLAKLHLAARALIIFDVFKPRIIGRAF